MSVARSLLTPGGYLELAQGAFVSFRGKACKIRRVMSLDSVVIQYVDGGETDRVHPIELRPVEEAVVESAMQPTPVDEGDAEVSPDAKSDKRDINDISDAEWEEAKALYEVIKPLLENPKRTRADVVAVATARGVQASTVYRWMGDYGSTGHVSGLIKGKRGRKKGTRLLTPEQEAIIDEALEEFLDPQAITPATLIEDLNGRFDDAGIVRPHPNTIRNRVVDIPLKRKMSARGNKELAKQRFDPTPGKFPDGTFPLECIQIDHVRLDMKVVDAETRQPIEKRPWLTLAIDSYSRMIVGYFLSLMSPSAFGAGVALYMGMMPKRDLLTTLDLPGRWPVFGKFRKVFADNAKEFKGTVLQRACEEHQIDLQLRPVKTPRYGAYIEAMVGNVNKQLHKKRGTTHRSPDVSPDYDSSEKSAFTLAALECDIVDWIVNSYQVDRHSAFNTTPLHKWEQGLLGDSRMPGVGLPPIPMNPEKLRLDFLPFERRAVHPYGVELGSLMFYHEVLNRWIGAADPGIPKEKRKFIFHYDPRTIRKIWFWDPEVKQHYEIPLKDTTWPDISWSEFDEYRKAMIKQGHQHVDEAAIKGYVQRSKIREQHEVEQTQAFRKGKTKPANRSAQGKPANTAPGSNHYAATPATTIQTPVNDVGYNNQHDDLFSTPAQPFADIEI
ncbi:Mu transposase C-terminal domain-containing protein [Sulfuritalea hydrogenivorans]|uniref:Urease subunit beta n=1 Tax=Sulfuritalea hydrogenivorans sk43H TaxID=1223802 RepID=W0SBN0_9PROT|nr:Mu transposase C-terminal domain-containing protein [Sulfuritalea hydrogenivorans]BAO28287.1 urease subunit beta [Sulfuritalea hydrogenivorans sk43H]